MVPPRLRGCCDSCTRSKLKCSGEMPSCQRCRMRGQDCVYSKARRAGRPRLRPKPSKASIASSVDRQPQTDLTSYSDQPVNGLRCLGSELPVSSHPDIVLDSPDSQDIAFLMEVTRSSTPGLSSEVAQPLAVSEFDDLMPKDLLWYSAEGHGSASSGTLQLEWSLDNAQFSDPLGDACPGHGATNEGTLGHTSTSPSSFYTDASKKSDDTSSRLAKIDKEINAIMATIMDITKRPMRSYHLHDDPCTTSWPQLLSKAQLLMYLAGSENSSSLRLDAVLQVSWTAEQVQKRISGCPTCMSRSMELSGMLALLYDWISSRIAYALDHPSVIQSCRLMIGNSVLTGQNGIIGTYELVKYRVTRAMYVVENLNNANITMGEGDPGRLYQVARLMLKMADSRLEAISGMIDLLASEQFCSIWG